jgi:hypothetical protein
MVAARRDFGLVGKQMAHFDPDRMLEPCGLTAYLALGP